MRKQTKEITIGNLKIGGNNPIAVQSMLNRPCFDIESNIIQAKELEAAGCQIVRAAVPNMEGVKLIAALKEAVAIPIVADIHFDYRLAVESAMAGADKIRINPGNIGGEENVKAVVLACREKNVPIRIGVNSGSVERELLAKYGGPTPQAMVESAKNHIALLEKYDFDNIVISIKSSHIKDMIAAYRIASESFSYPLHLGVTEAGTPRMGLVKSAVGIGSLLTDGIGDTIRVSLTAEPVQEISAAYDILKAVGYGQGAEVISCPTCGRTNINLQELAEKVEDALKDCKANIRVAVMGCAVNGPGEARNADVGITGGNGEGILFVKGEIVKKVAEDQLLPELLKLIKEITQNEG